MSLLTEGDAQRWRGCSLEDRDHPLLPELEQERPGDGGVPTSSLCSWQTRSSEEEVTCSRQRDAGLPVVLPRRAESAISPPLLPRIPEPRGPLAPRPRQASTHCSPPLQSRPAPPHKPISSRNLPALQLQRSPCSEALLPPEAASLNGFQFPEVVLSASRSDPGDQR